MGAIATKWRELAVQRLLGEFVLLGIVAVVVPQLPEVAELYPEWVLHSCIEFGKAFVVAGVLGWSIDRALKAELVKDAVYAALGYLLPERLKPELRWLYDKKVVVTQTFNARIEHLQEHKAVRLHGTYNRRFENVSGQTTVLERIGGGTSEMFSPIEESAITCCEYRFIRRDEAEKTLQIPIHKSALGIGYELKNVSLAEGEAIELTLTYTMIFPENGCEYLTHDNLIDRPLVNLDVDPTIVASITFSHRTKYTEASPARSGHISTRLERMLLPHQDIRIQWNKKTDVQQRIDKYGFPVIS